MKNLRIECVAYDRELDKIQNIRRTVFQAEQGVDAALEFDGRDGCAEHLLAYWQGEAVGTARIRSLDLDPPAAKIERLAVLPAARGQGIGKKLMEIAIGRARDRGFEIVVVNAQTYITELYQKLGFEPEGEAFVEAGIPHIKMIKMISRTTK